jgi:hypothetical protein
MNSILTLSKSNVIVTLSNERGPQGPAGVAANTTAQVSFPSNQSSTAINDLQKVLSTMWSSGIVEPLTIVKNGNGTLSLPQVCVVIRATNSETADLQAYHVAANASLSLTDLITNFIYVNYNNGSPIWAVSNSILTINGRNQVLAAIAFRNGNAVDVLSAQGWNVDIPTKRARRLFNVNGLEFGSGLDISSSNQQFALTAGVLYLVDNLISISSYDSSITPFTYIRQNGTGGFTRTSDNIIQNSTYDNNGVLTSFSGYRVDYIYVLVDNPSRFIVVLGQRNYNSLANAQKGSFPPVLPPELDKYGLAKCVGRAIIGRNDTTMVVESPFKPVFI